MWQSNSSWKAGIFSEIPFKRFQEIKTKSQWDSPLALFTRVNPNKGNDWPNLRLEGIQSATSPGIGAFGSLFSPNYYIIAIDTRLLSTDFSAEINSMDNIAGKVSLTVEYKVASLERILSFADPLQALKDRVQEGIQDSCAYLSYRSINPTSIRNSVKAIHAELTVGLAVNGISNIKITWPESITEPLSGMTVTDLTTEAKNRANAQKIQKLQDFGITDPVLIATVLSNGDRDFASIMLHVQNLSQAYQDQATRDEKLFNWLVDKDYISQADVKNLIDPLMNRMNNQNSDSGSVTRAIMSSSLDARRQLPGDGDEGKSANQNSGGSPIKGTRRVHRDDD